MPLAVNGTERNAVGAFQLSSLRIEIDGLDATRAFVRALADRPGMNEV